MCCFHSYISLFTDLTISLKFINRFVHCPSCSDSPPKPAPFLFVYILLFSYHGSAIKRNSFTLKKVFCKRYPESLHLSLQKIKTPHRNSLQKNVNVTLLPDPFLFGMPTLLTSSFQQLTRSTCWAVMGWTCHSPGKAERISGLNAGVCNLDFQFNTKQLDECWKDI